MKLFEKYVSAFHPVCDNIIKDQIMMFLINLLKYTHKICIFQNFRSEFAKYCVCARARMHMFLMQGVSLKGGSELMIINPAIIFA
jgi:hypothetical protein